MIYLYIISTKKNLLKEPRRLHISAYTCSTPESGKNRCNCDTTGYWWAISSHLSGNGDRNQSSYHVIMPHPTALSCGHSPLGFWRLIMRRIPLLMGSWWGYAACISARQLHAVWTVCESSACEYTPVVTDCKRVYLLASLSVILACKGAN